MKLTQQSKRPHSAIWVLGSLLVFSPLGARAQTAPDQLFNQNCAACHQATGKGVPGAFPALAGNAFVQGPAAPVAATVLNGRGAMPSFGAELSDAQIAAVLTYVRSSWGNHASAVSPALVAGARNAGSHP